MTTSTDAFFDEPLEQSSVKARIVSDYVVTFARILSDHQRRQGKHPRVIYADLFSGPGAYEDGTASTPLLVLRAAVTDAKLASSMQLIFNDRDQEKAEALREELRLLPGLEKLAHQPLVTNNEASIQFVSELNLDKEAPKLFFLDPFGYKALTMPLLEKILADWAECIFFFNYRRVIGAISNPTLAPNARKLFGDSCFEKLLERLPKLKSARQREACVIESLTEALVGLGAKHVMTFAFKVEDEQRSTHHLVFATRHRKGYEAMKTIMAKESTHDTEAGPSMSFTQKLPEVGLFDRNPTDVLAEEIEVRFRNRVVTVHDIYESYGPETLFTLPYFKRALLKLEAAGKIKASPVASHRPVHRGRQTMANSTVITFSGASNEPDINN